MAAKVFQYLIKRFPVSFGKRKPTGFTLIEILVSVIIVGFIFSALMSFVVELVQSERREYARSETEREMQMALDYMVSDLREAVFVYDTIEGNRNVLGNGYQPLKNFIPNFDASLKPILAFWKTDRLTDTDITSLGTCNAGSAAQQQECKDLLIKRRTLTLVVYLQTKNPTNDPKWKGKSRLMRYELKKYSNFANLTRSTGYVDPLEQSSFLTWPYNSTSLPPTPPVPTGGAPVLVDFVDAPDNISTPSIPFSIPPCTAGYNRIPTDQTNNNSFFTCVKTIDTTSTSIIPANQDVVIYLRGNPTGKAGIKVAPLITVKTQAVTRGVVDKQPQ